MGTPPAPPTGPSLRTPHALVSWAVRSCQPPSPASPEPLLGSSSPPHPCLTSVPQPPLPSPSPPPGWDSLRLLPGAAPGSPASWLLPGGPRGSCSAWALGARGLSLEALSTPTASAPVSAHVTHTVTRCPVPRPLCPQLWASQRQPQPAAAEQTPCPPTRPVSRANPNLPSPHLVPQASLSAAPPPPPPPPPAPPGLRGGPPVPACPSSLAPPCLSQPLLSAALSSPILTLFQLLVPGAPRPALCVHSYIHDAH